ncbi:MAG TPA: hypothetical protein VM285_16125, partial [Polyangia bacterium]|nr:hypothetical protein [Polyangia bacterium]
MNVSKVLGSSGTLTLINFGRKHAAKLAAHADPAINGGAAAITTATDALETAYGARRPLVSLWRQSTEDKDAADDALDGAIAAMSYELLGPSLLKGDRGSAAYRALFPEGNTAFIQGPDRAELAQVGGMVAYLEAHPGHPMAGRAADLAAKAATLAAALDPVTAAETALRAAQAVERDRRQALARRLRKSAAVLRAELM